MKPTKQIGIWMDHSTAFLKEVSGKGILTHIIPSEFTRYAKESSLEKNENLMHNKENQQQGAYYKKIADVLKTYEEIVLFGPTDAKNELLNLLKAERLFDNKSIEAVNSDKMTEAQMEVFVRDYFK